MDQYLHYTVYLLYSCEVLPPPPHIYTLIRVHVVCLTAATVTTIEYPSLCPHIYSFSWTYLYFTLLNLLPVVSQYILRFVLCRYPSALWCDFVDGSLSVEQNSAPLNFLFCTRDLELSPTIAPCCLVFYYEVF